MQRLSSCFVILTVGVMMAGQVQCQSPPILFQKTAAFFQDFMDNLSEATKKMCLMLSGFVSPTTRSSASTVTLPSQDTQLRDLLTTPSKADLGPTPSVASPTKTISTIVDPNTLGTPISEVKANSIDVRTRAGFDEKPSKQVEQLFKNGPIYEYETVTIRVPTHRARLSNELRNDLDVSESQVEGKYYIKKIKVPVRRMRQSDSE